MNVFEYVFPAIEGPPVRLSRWQGQPILISNTASTCDFTPQYRGLQDIYEEYRRSGLVVVALPCNDFGDCEAGDESNILSFVQETYDVAFPVTAPVQVRGLSAHPMFQAMRDQYGEDVMPHWNFHKYLFNRQGELVKDFPGKVTPADPEFRHQLERNLNAWIL